MADFFDPAKLAYAAAQEIRDMGPDKGTMLEVPFEGMCEVIAAAIVRGYHAGHEAALNERDRILQDLVVRVSQLERGKGR